MLFGLLLTGLFYPRTGMPLIPQLIGDIAPFNLFHPHLARHLYERRGLNFVWSDALILVIYTLIVVYYFEAFKMRLD